MTLHLKDDPTPETRPGPRGTDRPPRRDPTPETRATPKTRQPSLFSEPAERARAIGVFSFTGAAGASIGQVLGGVLTDALGWHWIFFINLPIGLAVLLVADRGRGLAAGADVTGALLVTAGLMLGIYTVVQVETYGWAPARTLGLGALALTLLAGFELRQATARTPLMPLRILRSREVSGANVVQMLMVAALFSFQIIVALHLQKVLGYGAAATGLAMLPVMLLAAGFGLALPALTSLGMSGAGEDDAGLASGLFNSTQQIGMALGVAVLTTLAAGRTEALRAAGSPSAEALTGGYRLALTVGAALLVAAFAAAFLTLRREPVGQAAP